MNIAKRCLLNTYLCATAPLRTLIGRRRRARHAEPVQILFYHRVADDHPNPWTIGCDAFARQIAWLEEHFDVISLEEAQRRISTGRNGRPSVVITFDDGYADNCDFALPLLLDRRLPFAYFVTTGNLLHAQPFAHDVERGTPLAPNSPADIQALAEAGIEIGAHTRWHVDLATVDPQRLHDEIVGSKLDLEQLIAAPVRYFAFPFGKPQNMTSAGFQVARSRFCRRVLGVRRIQLPRPRPVSP